MLKDYNEENFLLLEFLFIGAYRYLFLLIAIRDFCRFRRIGYFNRKNSQWSNSFAIKMITSIFMCINYGSMALLFRDYFGYYSFLYLLNTGIWVISTSLLYFGYRRKLPQAWLGLRLFWLLNGVTYVVKIVLISVAYSGDYVRIIDFIILSFIQAFLSIILMYCALFKPTDHENKIGHLLEVDRDNIEIQTEPVMEGIISISPDESKHCTSNLCLSKYESYLPLIILKISKVHLRKFSKQGDSLVLIRSNDNNRDNKKLKFSLRLLPTQSRNSKPTEKLYKHFIVKKYLKEVLDFNHTFIERYEKINYNRTVNPLLILLKNITKVIQKISLASDDTEVNEIKIQDNCSEISNHTMSNHLLTLSSVYVKLFQHYTFFASEFLKFLDVQDPTLIQNVLRNLEAEINNFGYKQNQESDHNAVCQHSKYSNSSVSKSYLHNSVIKASQNETKDFYSEVSSNVNRNTNDLIKIMTFINNIITSDNYLTIEVNSLKEKKVYMQSLVICSVYLSTNKLNSITVNIELSKFISYLDAVYPKWRKVLVFNELKKLIENPKRFLQIKNKNSQYKTSLSTLMTRIVNDLFFMDNNLFSLLQMSKVIALDINEIDSQILESFFELDHKASLSSFLPKGNNSIDKNIFNYKITSSCLRVERQETIKNKIIIVMIIKMFAQNVSKFKSESENLDNSTIDDTFTWEIELCLNDLLNIFEEVLEVNKNTNRFKELISLLNKAISHIHLLRRTLRIDNWHNSANNSNQKGSSDSDSLSISNRQSTISFQSKEKFEDQTDLLVVEFIRILNKFFEPPYEYMLYSQNFRNIFNLKVIFDRSNVLSNEEHFENLDEHVVSNSNKSILENLLT